MSNLFIKGSDITFLALCIHLTLCPIVFAERTIRNSVGNYFSPDGPRTAVTVANPVGLWIDTNYVLYYVDRGNGMIRSINQAGMVTTLVGTGVSGYTSDGQPGTSTQISLPLSVFVNTNGDVFFTHSVSLVRKLSKSTNIVTTVAGKLSANTAIDGVPATMSGLSTPRALW
eukprot:gene15244-17031_t